jgi:molecular chaperone DnaK
MAKEAEEHADEDKAKKEMVETRNMLDGAIYQAEKLKKDSSDKLADDDMKTLSEAIDAAKKVVADEKADKTAIENAAKELNDKMMPIGAKMYEQTASEETEAKDEPSDDKNDEAIEGEVVDEDKKDKKD